MLQIDTGAGTFSSPRLEGDRACEAARTLREGCYFKRAAGPFRDSISYDLFQRDPAGDVRIGCVWHYRGSADWRFAEEGTEATDNSVGWPTRHEAAVNLLLGCHVWIAQLIFGGAQLV